MELTDGEKLIVLMLTELYDKLGVDGEIDPEFIRSAIFDDATWSIPWKYSGIPFKEQETPSVVKEVIDILDMWSVIELSFERLPKESKTELSKQLNDHLIPPVFRGFDGNNESEHLGTAYFIINQLDRFEEFKKRDLNSHFPFIPRYRQMLSIFKELSRDEDRYLLSSEGIKKLLSLQH
jgi:uncharacterized protein